MKNIYELEIKTWQAQIEIHECQVDFDKVGISYLGTCNSWCLDKLDRFLIAKFCRFVLLYSNNIYSQ